MDVGTAFFFCFFGGGAPAIGRATGRVETMPGEGSGEFVGRDGAVCGWEESWARADTRLGWRVKVEAVVVAGWDIEGWMGAAVVAGWETEDTRLGWRVRVVAVVVERWDVEGMVAAGVVAGWETEMEGRDEA